jgi:hypothetical protein
MFDLYNRAPSPPGNSKDKDRAVNPYPYIVWRAPAVVYLTCTLDLFSGSANGAFHLTDCWFQHPSVVAGSRAATPELRLAIKTFVSRQSISVRRFDLCIVWAPDDGTYVDRNGKVTRSNALPKSRVGL